LKLPSIERSHFVPRRQTRRRDLQVMRADHLPAFLKVRPNPGMNARLRQVKGLNGQ
jgi:hypothetical protein